MRAVSGVAEQMFQALAEEGVNLKMITTGDIKISVLIEEDTPPTAETSDPDAPPVKQAHADAKRAIKGRRALRAIHTAFALAQPRKGAGLPTTVSGEVPFTLRTVPLLVPNPKDREAAMARLEGMEDVLVSGVHLNREQCRITIQDLPDMPGNCSKVFNAIATAGILVDMIVQNMTAPGRAELSFTVPRDALQKAEQSTRASVLEIDANCRVVFDDNVAVLYVLGVGMRTHTGVARTMFGALADQSININMINTSEVCIAVAVDRNRGEEALACLKQAFRV